MKKQKGISLIVLLIVIFLILALAGVGVLIFLKTKSSSNEPVELAEKVSEEKEDEEEQEEKEDTEEEDIEEDGLVEAYKELRYSYEGKTKFNSGLACLPKIYKDEYHTYGKYGYIDTTGKVVVDFKYKDRVDFENNYANVTTFEGDKKYALLKTTDDEILELDGYISEYYPEENLYHYFNSETGESKILNKDGESILDYKISSARDFHEGLALIKTSDGSFFINKNGEKVIDLDGYEILSDFNEGVATVYDKDNRGRTLIIDKEGNVIKEETDYLVKYGISDGLILVQSFDNNKYGFIDKNGNLIIDCLYDSAGEFKYGCAYVEKDEMCGLIDKSGNMIKELSSDSITGFSDNYLPQLTKSEDGKRVYIDKKKNEYTSSVCIGENRFIVEKDGKYGIIDADGNVYLDCKYDFIDYYADEIFTITEEKENNRLSGYVDIDGNIIIDIQYQRAEDFYNGYAIVDKVGAKNNEKTIIDEKGNEIGSFIAYNNGYYSDGVVLLIENMDDVVFKAIDKDGNVLFTNKK